MLYSLFNEFHVTPVFENSIKQSRCMKEIIAMLYNTSEHDDLSYEKKKIPNIFVTRLRHSSTLHNCKCY